MGILGKLQGVCTASVDSAREYRNSRFNPRRQLMSSGTIELESSQMFRALRATKSSDEY